MKSPSTGWLAGLFMFTAFAASSQSRLTEFYTFEKDQGVYKTIDTAKMQSISEGDVWVEDDVYEVPLPFKFRFLDQYLTTLKINQSNLFLPERDYFLATFGNFLMYDLANKDTLLTEGLSPISYIIDSSSGSKIMKIQWINAGFFFDSTMYLNVQVWLYAKNNNIEIRYGKSHIDLMRSQVIGCGPFVGIAKVDTLAGLDQYEMLLRNNAVDPQVATLQSAGKKCLNDVPPEGTIYRFVFHDSARTGDHYPATYAIYPNPGKGIFKADLTGPGPYTAVVYDMTGNKLFSSDISNGGIINLSKFRNGMYFVKIVEESVVYAQKILLIR